MNGRVAIVLGLWVASVGAGLVTMIRYQTTPGAAATPPTTRSVTTQAPKGVLMAFFHPQCPCSRATIGELARMETSMKGALEIEMYFYRPSSEADSWCRNTALWSAAAEIPKAALKVDLDGRVARSYGAHCSGQVLLYAAGTGRLVFSGGLTDGRGHEGETAAEDSILEYAQKGVCPVRSAPVYGCAIW